MFTLKVDQNVDIVFLHPRFKREFFQLFKTNKQQLTKWFQWPEDSNNEKYFSSLIEDALFEYPRGTALHCGVSYKFELIGYVGLSHINSTLGKAKLRFFISNEYQGRGIMAKTCQVMIEYAFDFLKLEKIEISIPTEDISSRKVCEALNFELEGIQKHAANVKGKVIDHAVYGLIKPIDHNG